MASGNSTEIIQYKQTAMNSIVSTQSIINAINSKYDDGTAMEPEDLFYTHVFPYGYLPETIETAGCYITLEVSMPSVSTVNYFFKDILLTVTIICHQDIMRMTDTEPCGATGATRTDYLAVEIDKLFNHKKGMGRKEMELVSNVEGAIDPVHRCRVMRFQTQDVTKSFCE